MRTILPLGLAAVCMIVVAGAMVVSSISVNSHLSSCWSREKQWRSIAEQQSETMKKQSEAIKNLMAALDRR